MLYKVFDFADTEAREVMVPRPNIAALSAEVPPKECLAVVIDSPYTRHPVYRGTLDNVIGVLHIRDIFAAYHHGQLEHTTIEQQLRPVPFIPETKNLGALLAEFRLSHQQMAIVLDEYGATQGLVTLEDLLEEIPAEPFHTIAGLVFDRLGRMPRVGDHVRVDGLRLRVLAVKGLRISLVEAIFPSAPKSKPTTGHVDGGEPT